MKPMHSLIEKYRPLKLGDLRGQAPAVRTLVNYAHSPFTGAFIFAGPPGVGKTAAAHCLARQLGCDYTFPELGGVHEVPSGKQDGGAVETLLHALHFRPLMGSGWKVAIINEADAMTKGAEVIWLDALENLPSSTTVIFTTNDVTRLSPRLVGRCELVRFSGDPAQIGGSLSDLLRSIWRAETGEELNTIPADVGRYDLFSGTLSFRLALQQIAPFIRNGEPLPAAFSVPMMRDERDLPQATPVQDYKTAARKAAATRKRRQSGASSRGRQAEGK